jgi:hypothetical protein
MLKSVKDINAPFFNPEKSSSEIFFESLLLTLECLFSRLTQTREVIYKLILAFIIQFNVSGFGLY